MDAKRFIILFYINFSKFYINFNKFEQYFCKFEYAFVAFVFTLISEHIIHTQHKHLFSLFIRISRHHKKYRLSDIYYIKKNGLSNSKKPAFAGLCLQSEQSGNEIPGCFFVSIFHVFSVILLFFFNSIILLMRAKIAA